MSMAARFFECCVDGSGELSLETADRLATCLALVLLALQVGADPARRYDERSCKRVGGAFPIALRTGLRTQSLVLPVCVIFAYTSRPGVQSWPVLENRCDIRGMS